MAIVTRTRKSVPACSVPWKTALKRAIRDADTLCDALELPADCAAAARRAAESFAVFAPWEYVAKMRPGDPHDPLLRQVLPVDAEALTPDGFQADPVGDRQAMLQPGLLQKYDGRVLLISTGVCAVHCRYCFRRHFPYAEGPRGADQWSAVLARVADDASIDEVLLSGGDPLTLGESSLDALLTAIEALPQVRRLRIHTRLPIVIPQRIDAPLLDRLKDSRLTCVVVVHANHPQELAEDVCESLGRLVDRGIPVFNQSVLLKGVNDNLAALEALCRGLVNARVTPYYLHQLDRVAGAAHFETPLEQGQRLIAALRKRLPGYAVPRFVVERAGEASKTVLA